MFNGIIYNQGTIKKIVKRPKGINIFVKSNLKLSKKDIGLSVACDGVCLTLISYKLQLMEFYLSKETIIRSKFKYIKNKDIINLELPLKYGTKISGHICQGHVDTVAKVLSIKKIDNKGRFDIKIILKKLYKLNCRNLLVEGGDELTNYLLRNKIFNIFYLYKSDKKLSKKNEYLNFNSLNLLKQKY